MKKYDVIKTTVSSHTVEVIASRIPVNVAVELVATGNRTNSLLRRNKWYVSIWCKQHNRPPDAAIKEGCLVYRMKESA